MQSPPGPVTTFEDLSDDIIIFITEYLFLEDFVSIFGKLNVRLAFIIFDHPWIRYQLVIQNIDNTFLRKKIAFLEETDLKSSISSIIIRPYSICRSIEIFTQSSPIDMFVNLQAFSLTNVTLDEVGFGVLSHSEVINCVSEAFYSSM
jgi:hypothetical protein